MKLNWKENKSMLETAMDIKNPGWRDIDGYKQYLLSSDDLFEVFTMEVMIAFHIESYDLFSICTSQGKISSIQVVPDLDKI